jgi:hypothetical protein
MHIGDVASSEMIKVLEPYEWFTVTKDGQQLIKFAKEKVNYYNPRAGYGYYEFTQPGYVISKRNVMALTKVKIESFMITANNIISYDKFYTDFRMENYTRDLVCVTSFVLLETMMKLK